MNLYPVLINIKKRLIVVIGGGEVALRKIKELLEAGASVRVISPVINRMIFELAGKYGDMLEIVKRKYSQGDLTGAYLVFSAANDAQINKRVYEEAEKSNILINAVDDPANCSFIIPSMIRKGELILSLSTSGASPALAARLRRELEVHIPDNIDDILHALRIARQILKLDDDFDKLDSIKRGSLLNKIANSDDLLSELVSSQKGGTLKFFLNKLLS